MPSAPSASCATMASGWPTTSSATATTSTDRSARAPRRRADDRFRRIGSRKAAMTGGCILSPSMRALGPSPMEAPRRPNTAATHACCRLPDNPAKLPPRRVAIHDAADCRVRIIPPPLRFLKGSFIGRS
ncbi:hypothetical protein MPPM_1179 [Methylorubrum populi]|uniref:Uncharacterized protein n=1 Tax=Methylorubrum populi TaxID=223967 RepID=A0A160PBR5_9HYPH|nr:hypothetical protein MPPM_1179 [Methylorubrum populi]